jgi:hypothetical protein
VFGRIFGRQIAEARRAIVESVHLYGVTSAAREVVEAYVEMIVSAVLGMLEALIDGRVRDREVAIDALADLTTMALRNPSPRESSRR